MNIQTIVMDEIKRTAEEQGFTIATEYHYKNMGTCYIMNGFKTILAFSFDFQSTWKTATFEFFPGDKKVVSIIGGKDKNCILKERIEYHQMETKMPEVITFIKGQLAS